MVSPFNYIVLVSQILFSTVVDVYIVVQSPKADNFRWIFGESMYVRLNEICAGSFLVRTKLKTSLKFMVQMPIAERVLSFTKCYRRPYLPYLLRSLNISLYACVCVCVWRIRSAVCQCAYSRFQIARMQCFKWCYLHYKMFVLFYAKYIISARVSGFLKPSFSIWSHKNCTSKLLYRVLHPGNLFHGRWKHVEIFLPHFCYCFVVVFSCFWMERNRMHFGNW